ncbi:MAG: hypothetical protein RLZZ44_367 [Bacteroidota bacterium]|jgi:surface carbohydrate biosynthesis protein
MIVYLPLEIYSRELLSKLLLSSYLLQNTEVEAVIIGHNARIKSLALRAEKPGIYYEVRGMAKKGMEYLEILKSKGFKLVGQDEESGISFKNWLDFFDSRSELRGLSIFDTFFAWTQEEKVKLESVNSEVKIVDSGSPRYSLWGNNGFIVHKSEIEEVKQRLGNFVLVVTSFATANSNTRKRSFLRQYINLGYGISAYRSKYNKYRWQKRAIAKTIEIIEVLLANTDFRILLRPHPVENVNFWKKKFINQERVTILAEPIVQPYILSAQAILHSGSTLALEAASYGKQIINYANLIKDDKIPKIVNDITKQINNFDELISAVKTLSFENSTKKIPKKFDKIGSMEPIVIQSEEILKLIDDTKLSGLNEIQVKTNERDSRKLIRKYIGRILGGKYEFDKIEAAKRPNLNLNTIIFYLERVDRIFKTNTKISIIELENGVFSLTRNLS